MTDVQTLRPFTAALDVLTSYGAEIPEPLTVAKARLHEARIAARAYAVTDVATDAAKALGAADLAKALDAAAKARATAVAREEIARALYPAAIREALLALNACADDVTDAVLSSPALASAFAEIERLAPLVPASMVAKPDAEVHGLDAVANVAMLRRAASVFEVAFGRLDAVGVISSHAPEAAAVLYLSPGDDTSRESFTRVVKGVRPGALSVTVWSKPLGSASPVSEPVNALGVPAAIALATEGVTLSLATSARDLAERVRVLGA